MTYLRMPYCYFAFEKPDLRLGEFKLSIVLIVLGSGLLLERFNTKKNDYFVEKKKFKQKRLKSIKYVFVFYIIFK